ncbi:multidrug transporter [uncultured archaeon]|nr:multidrug transporter [uncultured archaeon]
MKLQSVLLSFSKFVRSFVLTMIAVITPFYLSGLGLSALGIGAVIVLAVVISTVFVYTFAYLKVNLRNRMLLLASLFTASMAILLFSSGFYLFIVALIIGGITLSGRDMTANETIEKFSISTYEPSQRSKNYAFSVYNFSSYGAGSLASLILFIYGSGNFQFYFLIDLVLAALQFIPYLAIKFPEKIERESPKKFDEPTLKTVRKLSYLFAMDAFGGGLVVTSVIALWFKAVYNISLSQAGLMFVIINVVTAVSIIIASMLADRLGLIRTMVYSHIVSNFFLIMVPVFHTLLLSQIMLYLRQTTSQMDVPGRDSFINTIIPPEHRIRSNSNFLVVRNGSQVPGPGIAGLLIETAASSVFFLGGGIKILYDILLFVSYRNYKE